MLSAGVEVEVTGITTVGELTWPVVVVTGGCGTRTVEWPPEQDGQEETSVVSVFVRVVDPPGQIGQDTETVVTLRLVVVVAGLYGGITGGVTLD